MKKRELNNNDPLRAMNAGFDSVEARMATKDQLRLVIDGLNLVRADVVDIKRTLGPLVNITAAGERRMNPVTAA